MGTTWSRTTRTILSTPEITEKAVLTLCDDGDLLLMRELVVHAKLRITIEKHVAQDISRFQQGEFPTARVTQLPAWTSCGLLLRVDGILHILVVDSDGMRTVPFTERVANRGSQRDTYAIRRLQHGRNEQTSEMLRQLQFELSQVLPLHWHQLLEPSPTGPTALVSTSPPRPSPSGSAIQAFAASLTKYPLLRSTLQRTLELNQLPVASELSAGTILPAAAPGSLSPVDTSAHVAASLVVAIYEQLGFVQPSLPLLSLLPSALYSKTEPPTSRVDFSPANALGVEMKLQ